MQLVLVAARRKQKQQKLVFSQSYSFVYKSNKIKLHQLLQHYYPQNTHYSEVHKHL